MWHVSGRPRTNAFFVCTNTEVASLTSICEQNKSHSFQAPPSHCGVQFLSQIVFKLIFDCNETMAHSPEHPPAKSDGVNISAYIHVQGHFICIVIPISIGSLRGRLQSQEKLTRYIFYINRSSDLYQHSSRWLEWRGIVEGRPATLMELKGKLVESSGQPL